MALCYENNRWYKTKISYTYDEKGQCTGITVSWEENGETITITSHYVYNTKGDIIQSIDNAGEQ